MNINYALGGTILLGLYLGFMVATLTTGILADAIGLKLVLVLAGVGLVLGAGGFAQSTSPGLLSIFMTLLGFGLGSLELGCNALIVRVHASDTGRYLNLLAVMHGLGSMAAPLFAGWMLAAQQSWRAVYRWDILLAAVLIIIFLGARFPKTTAQGDGKINFKQVGKTIYSPLMLTYYFAYMIYVAAEIGFASWVVEYLQKVRGQDINLSAQALSIFFALVTVGRFVGSFYVEKVGYLRSILLAALAASLCLAGGLIGPASLWWLLPASGFFLSIIFPTFTASVSSTYQENVNTILGLLFFFAGFGGMFGPWLIGIASDLGGIQFGFGLVLIYCLLTAAAAFALIKQRPAAA